MQRKFDTARRLVPKPVIDTVENTRLGIIALGTTQYAIEEARDYLAKEGLDFSFLRVRSLPVNTEVREFVEAHERVYVIELNRDGQLHAILQTELPDLATRLVSVAHLDGMPLTAQWLEARLKKEEKEEQNGK